MIDLRSYTRPRFVLATATFTVAACFALHAAWIPIKAEVAQVLLQRAWSKSVDGHAQTRPWPWADTWPVARLTATSHDVDLIVLAGGSGRTLAFGPGHLGASALPGEIGNMVIAGHRDTHFAFLQEVRRGDRLGIGQQHLRIVRNQCVGLGQRGLGLDRIAHREVGAPEHDHCPRGDLRPCALGVHLQH